MLLLLLLAGFVHACPVENATEECDAWCKDRYRGRRDFYNVETGSCQNTAVPVDKKDEEENSADACGAHGTYDPAYGICLCESGFAGSLCEREDEKDETDGDSSIGEVVVEQAYDLSRSETPQAIKDAQQRQIELIYTILFVVGCANALLCCLSVPIQRRQKTKEKDKKKKLHQEEAIEHAAREAQKAADARKKRKGKGRNKHKKGGKKDDDDDDDSDSEFDSASDNNGKKNGKKGGKEDDSD